MTSLAALYGRQSRGKKKSIAEQILIGKGVALEQGWTLPDELIYQDRVSASRFARVLRDAWPQVREGARQGRFEVLILWETSRADRELESWAGFLSDCRRSGVLIYVITDERAYDVRNASDWENLASQGVSNAVEAEKTSKRVQRGHAGAALTGRPSHGRAPYGYRRTYDPTTGELIGQEPEPEQAPIVLDIFKRLADGASIRALATKHDLDPQRVRFIALNPAYMGMRQYNGKLYEGDWKKIVEPDLFYEVNRILLDPRRVTTKPGKQKWLLSRIATCGVCQEPLGTSKERWYRCAKNGCVRINMEETDAWVTRAVIAYLSQPDVYSELNQQQDTADHTVTEIRNNIAQWRAQLDQWRQSAIDNVTSPESLAVIERNLTWKITQAEASLTERQVPAVLRGFVGPGVDVEARWNEAPVPARRALIRAIMSIRIERATTWHAGRWDHQRVVIGRVGVTT